MQKYKLTDETKIAAGHVLHRIEAMMDFGDVHAGDLGGTNTSSDVRKNKAAPRINRPSVACCSRPSRTGWF